LHSNARRSQPPHVGRDHVAGLDTGLTRRPTFNRLALHAADDGGADLDCAAYASILWASASEPR